MSLEQALDHSKELIQGLLLLGGVVLVFWGLGQLDKWNTEHPKPKSRPIAYVCSADDKSAKCYELPIGTYEDCDGESCTTMPETIYWPNGGNSDLSDCISIKGSKSLCMDDENRSWEIQDSGNKTTEKYYPDGRLAN